MDLPLDQMQENASRATSLLKVMANEMRLMILCQLAVKEMSVGELLDVIPLSQSALSQHLSALRKQNVVKTRRQSQFIWYSLASEDAIAIIQTLYNIYCGEEPGEECHLTANEMTI